MNRIAATIIASALWTCHPAIASDPAQIHQNANAAAAAGPAESAVAADAEAFYRIALQREDVGDLAGAEHALARSIVAATDSKDEQRRCSALLEQARLFAIDGRKEDATKSIDGARQLAAMLGDPAANAKVSIEATALVARGIGVGDLSAQIAAGLRAVLDIHDNALRAKYTNDLIEAAVDAFVSVGTNPADAALLQTRAAAVRNESENAGSSREGARASHELARLYLLARQYDDATASARGAAVAAQRAGDDETLYRTLVTLARSKQANGHMDNALRDLRLAVDTFEKVRDVVTQRFLIDADAFRDRVGDSYLALVDVLLKSASEAKTAEAYSLRVEAIATMERFRTSELRSYLLNTCVDQPKLSIPQVIASLDPRTAVLYPVALRDRLEILLISQTGISQHSIPLSANALESEFKLARQALETRNSDAYRIGSTKLHALLVEPFNDQLRDKFDTLVYVPDSWLRLIPLGALWNGDSFLIEKYAVVTAPYLSRSSPADTRGGTRAFAGGISLAVQGYPALPGVARELDAVSHDLQSRSLTTLRDAQFTSAAFRSNLESGDYEVIHLATHGEFTARANQSYLITYDGRIPLSDLDASFSRQQSGAGTDLMVLSACQTAAGDDRSTLGLAGIALKAGARDTLATLWYVSDAAAAQLISTFYQNLGTGVSPEQALRHAQVELIKSERFSHPDFWSPFIMIGGAETPPKLATTQFATNH